MKIKKIIILIFLLALAFYIYRIYVEIKSKSVCFIMNYKSFLNYYGDENEDIDAFIDELLSYKVYSIYVYPSDLSDFVNEYNKVFLTSGIELDLLFNTERFNRNFCYLVIPEQLKNIVIKLKECNNKFFYKEYLIYEFTDNRSRVNKIPVDYKPKFEDMLTKRNINVIKLKNEPLLKNIDNFLIMKKDFHYYLTDRPKEYELMLKTHRFNKRLFQKKDVQTYIDENYRAVLERNVKGIMIHTLYLENRIVKLSDFLPDLMRKFERRSYAITRIEDIDFELNYWIIFSYKIVIFLLTIVLLIHLFPEYLKYFIPVFILLAIIRVLSAYVVQVFLFYYFINDFILRLNKEDTFDVKNLLLFIGATFLTGICISNFLFEYKSFFGPSGIRGVKISFLLPFIIWPVQYIRARGYKFRKILKADINLLRFMILNVTLFLMAFLILRSGNYYLTVSNIELKLRQFLEDIFFIRPRFKEIFFYPFLLFLFIGQKVRLIKNNLFLIYFLALIAVSTTINSFLHIHTLSYYSIIRSLTGIGVGFVIGGLGCVIGKKWLEKPGKDKVYEV